MLLLLLKRHEYPRQPGHHHTFLLTATDRTGNQATAEDQAGIPRVTKYYYHGGRRVAMRRSTASGSVVYYLHGDHLGSTSLTTYGSGPQAGQVVARHLYHPYGETRWQDGTLPTDFTFTGQRGVPGTGLVFMHARYYHPGLGRFVSADSIVPNPGNPQDLNRYVYVRNNPLKYRDPSGHAECIDAECRMLVNPSNGNVMIADTGGSALYELILLASLGNDTAANRLVEILDATSSGPWLHFSGLGARRGDTGFRPEFRDDHLYGDLWGVETPASRQVGHFLTAVDMGYGPGRWENSLIRSIVGHEMVTDAETKVGMPFRTMVQIAEPGTGEINLFKAAARLDAANCPLCDVDAALFPLFDPAKYGKQEDRIGNSMEDLRLSVRGWRLGQMVESGDLKTNKDLANWIALNVAE